jgi:hypothetical protein
MSSLMRHTRLLALGIVTVLVLAACAGTESEVAEDDNTAATTTEETADEAPETSPDPTPTADETEHDAGHDDAPEGEVAAADLRTLLNTQLTEHTFFAGAAVVEALQGNEAGFEAAAAALDENSVALSESVGLVYGPEAGEAFLGLWRSHIDMFVAYTQATAAGDEAGQQAAVEDLTGYANDFAVFLNGANPELPVETVEGLVMEHVLTTKDTVDAFASGDAQAGFTSFRGAMGHMSMIADPLSGAIAAQFPDRFPGETDSAAADVQKTLNVQLLEHTYLAGAAVNEALKGNTENFEAAAAALDGNSVDLAATVGSVYGEDAEQAFLGLWRSHIDMFVAYTQATAAGDEAGQQAAVEDLQGYATDFAVFLNGATGIDQAAAEDLVGEHVLTLKDAVDSIATGEGNPFIELREAGSHMNMIADPLADAIVTQQGL